MARTIKNPDRTFKSRVATLSQFDDPDMIAEYLNQRGFKGMIAKHDSCPITSYLSKDMPDDIRVSTMYVYSVLYDVAPTPFDLGGEIREFNRWQQRTQEPLSEAVQQFIRNFDARQYPDLIEYEYDV